METLIVFFQATRVFIKYYFSFFPGCLLQIYCENETDCPLVATLACDPETPPTFELTLTLRQAQRADKRWRQLLPDLVR